MGFIKKNYWILSLLACFAAGFLFFSTSYRSSRKQLISEISHTIEVVTNVKQQLLERKLYSLGQQLDLLTKDDEVNNLLAAAVEKKQALINRGQFEEYIKSLLYNQGFMSLLIIQQSGDIVYASNPDPANKLIHKDILRFIKHENGAGDSTGIAKIILGKEEPFQFIICERITDAKGGFHGAIFIEIPREFLSIELHNAIFLDSLDSYLTSTQGTMDQLGKMHSDSCRECGWDTDKFLVFSPSKKIAATWTLSSVYPIAQISVQHILYLSALDGMIAFLVTGIIALSIIYGIQVAQKRKGVTHSDILLVQTTWNTVSEYSTKVVGGFYKHLFAAAPEVKPMFKSEKIEQEKRMALMINTIVNSADSMEEFKGSISQLAKKTCAHGGKKRIFSNCSEGNYQQRGGSIWVRLHNSPQESLVQDSQSGQRCNDRGNGKFPTNAHSWH
jgi:hypothetical protein